MIRACEEEEEAPKMSYINRKCCVNSMKENIKFHARVNVVERENLFKGHRLRKFDTIRSSLILISSNFFSD
jgi:hypothetical protein